MNIIWMLDGHIFVFNIPFFGCTGSLLLHGLFSNCGKQGVQCTGFSLQSIVLLWTTAYRGLGLQELWHVGLVISAHGSRAQAQHVWCRGLVGPWHVGSSQIRDRTCLLPWQVDSFPLSQQGIPWWTFLYHLTSIIHYNHHFYRLWLSEVKIFK